MWLSVLIHIIFITTNEVMLVTWLLNASQHQKRWPRIEPTRGGYSMFSDMYQISKWFCSFYLDDFHNKSNWQVASVSDPEGFPWYAESQSTFIWMCCLAFLSKLNKLPYFHLPFSSFNISYIFVFKPVTNKRKCQIWKTLHVWLWF